MNKEKREIKEQVLFELNIKLTNKTYNISFSTRRAWLVGVSLIVVRLILALTGKSP